ncbi:hypothetical protein G6F24_014940 [Rhizopus arrhizus]|nr:hypothetical protein G6F24_014940 [Rhizopus arrhizus]
MAKERLLWIAGGLFLLLVGYAVFNGLLQTSLRDNAQTALTNADTQARGEQLAQLNRIMAGIEKPTPFGNPASPANMGGGLGAHYAIMPSVAMAPVALGQTDLFPSQFRVTYQSKRALRPGVRRGLPAAAADLCVGLQPAVRRKGRRHATAAAIAAAGPGHADRGQDRGARGRAIGCGRTDAAGRIADRPPPGLAGGGRHALSTPSANRPRPMP